MKKLSFCLLLLFYFQTYGQVNVKDGGVISIGVGSRSISHSGILYFIPSSVEYNNWNISALETSPAFHCNGIGTDIQITQFSDNGMINYGVDGLVYLLSLFPYTHDEHSGKLRGMIGLTTKELSKSEFPYLDDRQRRMWSWKLVDVTSIFGKHDLGFGFHLSFRELGYTNFTYYSSQDNSRSVYQPGSNVGKLFIGPALAYRKTIGALSFTIFGGVNTTPNVSRSIHVTMAPYIKPTVYLGKKAGLCLSLYYEQMHNKEFSTQTGLNYDKLNYKELKLCVGLYLTSKKD